MIVGLENIFMVNNIYRELKSYEIGKFIKKANVFLILIVII